MAVAINTDYGSRFSTDLLQWDALPEAHYTVSQDSANDQTKVQLDLTHDYGTQFFLQLVRP